MNCPKCDSFMNGDSCSNCLYLKQPTEVRDSNCVRCPHCGHIHKESVVMDGIDPFQAEDAGIEMLCHNCDEEFQAKLYISYTFTSPALNEAGRKALKEILQS